MIALDTNVLVRYLVDDDAKQAEAARKLLEALAPTRSGFVCRKGAETDLWPITRANLARPLYTFDRKAARLPDVALLAASAS